MSWDKSGAARGRLTFILVVLPDLLSPPSSSSKSILLSLSFMALSLKGSSSSAEYKWIKAVRWGKREKVETKLYVHISTGTFTGTALLCFTPLSWAVLMQYENFALQIHHPSPWLMGYLRCWLVRDHCKSIKDKAFIVERVGAKVSHPGEWEYFYRREWDGKIGATLMFVREIWSYSQQLVSSA